MLPGVAREAAASPGTNPMRSGPSHTWLNNERLRSLLELSKSILVIIVCVSRILASRILGLIADPWLAGRAIQLQAAAKAALSGTSVGAAAMLRHAFAMLLDAAHLLQNILNLACKGLLGGELQGFELGR